MMLYYSSLLRAGGGRRTEEGHPKPQAVSHGPGEKPQLIQPLGPTGVGITPHFAVVGKFINAHRAAESLANMCAFPRTHVLTAPRQDLAAPVSQMQ